MKKEPDGTKQEPVSGLGQLLSLGLEAGKPWTPQELAEMLQEQMQSSVEVELASFRPAAAEAMRVHAAAQGLVLKSLHELLEHPRPPLPLLVITKDFFKANTAYPNPSIPAEIARVLYFITIAVAWLRHHARISKLSDQQVLDGLTWVKRQTWVSAEVRDLAETATSDLKTRP